MSNRDLLQSCLNELGASHEEYTYIMANCVTEIAADVVRDICKTGRNLRQAMIAAAMPYLVA